MQNPNIEAVEKYIYSFKNKDLSQAPFADDVRLEDSMMPEMIGADNVRAHLANFLPIINDVHIHSHIADGNRVATHWEVDSAVGPVKIMEMFTIENGLIKEAIGYFDPRPLLG